MAARRPATTRTTKRTSAALKHTTPRRRPLRPVASRDWDRRLATLGDPANPWHPMRDE